MSFALACAAATIPTQPTITVGSPQTHSLVLTLTVASTEAIHGLFGYDIESSLDGITWSVIASNYTGGFPYVASGLNPGAQYFFRVRGISGADGAYRSKPSAVANGTTTSTGGGGGPTRRYFSSHFVAVRPADINNFGGIPHAGTITSAVPPVGNPNTANRSAVGPVSDGVSALVVRYNWGDVETTAGVFDYTKIDKHIAQCATFAASANSPAGVGLFLLIVTRTFDGSSPSGGGAPTNPMPADLASYTDLFSTSASGTLKYGRQGWRWSPTVRSRFNNFCAKLGARYNSNPLFAGIGTQETSTGNSVGGSTTVYTVGSYTGQDAYTAAGFQQGLDDEADSISKNCQNARGMHYLNFGLTKAQLTSYAAYAVPNGAMVGCPDLVTGASGNANIVNNVYPILAAVQNATAPVTVVGPIFASIQSGEWNGSGVGDSPPNMPNLFNYFTSTFTYKPVNGFAGALDWRTGSPLKGGTMVWDWETGAGRPNFQLDAAPIISANPDIDPYVPPSSGTGTIIYVDLNGGAGNGQSPSTPTNVLPSIINDNTTILFNSDNGIQTIPSQDDGMYPAGANIKVASYGSGRAVISGFQQFTAGWTLVSGTVYSRSYNPTSGDVGAVINMNDTTGSPQGTVLNWTNLTTPSSFTPSTLAVGAYAYDWSAKVMYVNIGSNANAGKIGISCCGRFISVQPASSPTIVEITNLRVIGFAKAAINIVQMASQWHVHHNQLYANGGQFVQGTNPVYEGTGIQIAGTATNIEIDNNLIEQTFDSPISPQHFGGTSGDTIDTIHIHHNTISHGALAGIELSDFGTGNTTSNVEVDHNIITGMGTGFSGIGHSAGYCDAIHFRGDATRVLSGINIHDNTLNGFDAGVGMRNGTSSDQVLVTNNRLSGARYGIYNTQTAVTINASGNSMCANSINDVHDVNQTPVTLLNGGTYSGNTHSATQCVTPPISGQGVQP